MKWLDEMNRALNYIEKNLKGKTDYVKIAQTANCSVYHFQRMFTFMTNVTLSEYIRRRKLTMAAFDLQQSDRKVIDIAADYGYDSPEAFARAFQNMHGITPTAARSRGAHIKAYLPVTFQITIKGVNEMNYKIVEKPAFEVYGVEGIFDTAEGKNFIDIPVFWQEKIKDGAFNQLMKSAGYPCSVNAVCGYGPAEGTNFPYMLCVIKTPLSNTDGYKTVEVPASTWAVFTNEPHTLEETSKCVQDLTSRIYTDWLPTSNYKLTGGYDFEMYYSDMNGKCYEEVWIRVTEE